METVTTAFNEKITDHFLNPRNIGEIENADGSAIIGDPSCGDYIKVWISVKNETITDFKYKVFGCWGAIATTSVVSELAIGKSLREASRLTDDDVISALGQIPPNKRHCSLLGIQGLRTAIAEFLITDSYRKYNSRIEKFRTNGYDIPAIRKRMVGLLSDLSPGISILDVGTGKGHLALAIAQSGRRCTAIDISQDELYMAELNAIHFRVDTFITFQQQDARELKFSDHSMDAVLSANLFHHLIHPELVLREMVRVCKPGGKIIISDLNEKGKMVIDNVHKDEGREHVHLGWSIKEIQKWLERQNFHMTSYIDGCETILIIEMKS